MQRLWRNLFEAELDWREAPQMPETATLIWLLEYIERNPTLAIFFSSMALVAFALYVVIVALRGRQNS